MPTTEWRKRHSRNFISKFGLGAAKLTVPELNNVYDAHREWMSNTEHLAFIVSRNIDAPQVEYGDDSSELLRSPREWARSLKDDNNASLGVNLDNGGKDGRAVLFVSRQHLETVKLQLATYQQHQNPRMAGPNSFYTEFKEQASQIPETVFTANI